MEALEKVMPMWLAEYLLLSQIPPNPPPVKVSFVLIPWNKDPDIEPLPELLNT
jgi:WD repeat-containing protein 48